MGPPRPQPRGLSVSTAAAQAVTVVGDKHRLDHVDALRALAVLAVLALHVRGFWVLPEEGRGVTFVVDRLAAQGAAGVDLFIVLSGFCMAYPLLRGRSDGIARLSARRFYRRRAVRLLPAYYVCVLGLFALGQLPAPRERMLARPPDLQDLVLHLVLLQPLSRDSIGAVNGPLWSISLEVTLYLVFPLVLVALRRYGWHRLVVGTVLLAVVWAGVGAALDAVAPDRAWLPDPSKVLPARLFEFAFGMLAAQWLVRPEAWHRRTATAVLVLGALAGAAGTVADVGLVRVLGWGAASFGLTVLASRGLPARRWTRPVTALGLVSYSFYLLHQPFLLLTAPVTATLSPAAVYALAAPVALAALYALARLFFQVVERPFLLAGGMRDAIVPDRPPTPVPPA